MSVPIAFSNSTGCSFFLLFIFSGFGGAGDRRFGVDFGGARFGVFCQDCRPGVRSFFGGEIVEFVLSGYGDFDVFGVGGRGSVYRWLRDP
jgi:hypothetical protein